MQGRRAPKGVGEEKAGHGRKLACNEALHACCCQVCRLRHGWPNAGTWRHNYLRTSVCMHTLSLHKPPPAHFLPRAVETSRPVSLRCCILQRFWSKRCKTRPTLIQTAPYRATHHAVREVDGQGQEGGCADEPAAQQGEVGRPHWAHSDWVEATLTWGPCHERTLHTRPQASASVPAKLGNNRLRSRPEACIPSCGQGGDHTVRRLSLP